MHIRRVSFKLITFIFVIMAFLSFVSPFSFKAQTNPQQQLVENVDIQGNRRLRDEDLLFYIQTRQGDPFDPQQLERDLQALLSLNFFDKTSTRVLTEPGARGGVNVIFEVKELPIIRDLQFEGLKSVPESDVLKAFRENRVGVSKESIYDPVKARRAVVILKELLSAKGHPNAIINIKEDEVSATSVAITFEIEEGDRVRIAKLDFEGNKVFSDKSLRNALKLVKPSTGFFTGFIARIKGQDILDRQKLDYDLNKNVRDYMRSKGYLNARIGEPQVEGLGRRRTGFFLPIPFLSSVDDTLKVTIPVTEGKPYRIGDVKVEGNSIFSAEQIQAILGLKKGEIANGEQLSKALFENLKKIYGAQGFIQYDVEIEPDYKDNPQKPEEGIADFTIRIDEGKQFTLRRLEFSGNTFTRDVVLRREMLVSEGDVFNLLYFEVSVQRLNQLQIFDPIDKDKDVDRRTDEEQGFVDMTVKVSEKGRQQISFNGGTSGIGGTFFGVEYSTNNLFGRGETLTFNLAAGNRQSSFQFSFTEPYFKNRPITVGFSVFAYKQQFFGEGTFLSSNQAAQVGAINPLGFLTTDEENLFTRRTYGASVFLSSLLSEFWRKRPFTQLSRVGASYSFSTSSIKDPKVNQAGDPDRIIPIIYSQPNITTSRLTGTFVYDSRNYSGDSTDPVTGRQITFSLGFAGLGGDVRTYEPSISYIQFIPVRRKRSENPEVFGFRILAGHAGSFAISDKVRNANSLSFVNGIPIFERFFLGDEFTIRGYNVRSIGPLAPVDTYVTTRNVVVAYNSTGDPVPVAGISDALRNAIAAIGTFTGSGGTNPSIPSRSATSIGGDTQLLANLEYRIPILGPASIALFADVGTAFNLRKGDIQTINTNFLRDQPFLFPSSINSLVVQKYPQFASSFLTGALLLQGNQLLLRGQLSNLPPRCLNFPSECGIEEIHLRGEAQTNTLIRLADSSFAKFGDFRSSVGAEFRVQVPVINVPFRLIYFFNPNARTFVTINGQQLNFGERRNGFRFSVGRTF
jgi:outer membrane protein insertion porin family